MWLGMLSCGEECLGWVRWDLVRCVRVSCGVLWFGRVWLNNRDGLFIGSIPMAVDPGAVGSVRVGLGTV